MKLDEGITATNTKKRDDFKRMVNDALPGKIDLIVTKSVSRFARNTVDSLSTIRKLKEHGTEVYFEKKDFYTEKNTDKCGKYGTFQRVMVFGWCLNLCDTVIRY